MEPGTIPAFGAWSGEALTGGERVVEGFATSRGQDGAADRAGLYMCCCCGQAEGQADRLKLLNRSMYGRAKLDLLRRRLLLAA
ncbi:hypothetical protein AFCDBAGC_0182 [Methylobacterium cerastii]|uniref:Transposase n=2 Tax=Methylobacterium TaxID=407 RepID=A0ABQ4U840_9HYPH|nr:MULTISPECIES: hypothetical protein [Methylobacterium]TXM79409.1 hypothetical protein FV218_00525 [Methylobacterium sp. WL69]TXN23641.1 hypothetical protein FV220_20940 [Methylobacterium sp. WL19]GJD42346.1 hypothetical protein AFCDBAGC_0182 [Methylobacterium cerastii]GJE62310.1 hypothetical protein MPOCJGCO_4443 [Methylobacterium trifolii]